MDQIQVLDKGFVRHVDHMGSDSAIVQAARVSYGAGTKTVNEDEGLIRYLLRHDHTTPFEMCEVKFHVKVPMDCWRQWIRHRTANVNEYSTRYSEAIDDKQQTTEWRAQSKSNKQGSANLLEGALPVSGLSVQTHLSQREADFHAKATELYKERLELGVAREQARKDLPLSTYTEAYWKCDLHNLMHFLRLRLAPEAQLEIRSYAQAIAKIVKELFPITYEAFECYKLKTLTLNMRDIAVIQAMNNGGDPIQVADSFGWTSGKSREFEEFKRKCTNLGIKLTF